MESTSLEQRQKQLKGNPSSEDGRRRRVQHSIELRKNKRQESLQKRRNLARTPPPAPDTATTSGQDGANENKASDSNAARGLHERVDLANLDTYAKGEQRTSSARARL